MGWIADCFLTRHAGVIWLLGGEVKGALPFSRRSGMIDAAMRHHDVRMVKFDGISTFFLHVSTYGEGMDRITEKKGSNETEAVG